MNKLASYKNNIKKLLDTGFFHIFTSSVINKIIAFLSNIVVVRLVSKVDFGIYTYALNILSFVILLSGLGLVSGTFQLCSEKKDVVEKERIFQYGCTWGIRINLVLSLIIIIIAKFCDLKVEGSNELLFLMFANPILVIIFELQQIYLRSNFENKKFSYASTLNSALLMFFSIIGAIILGVKGLIFGKYIAYILTSGIALFKLGAPIFLKNNYIEKQEKKDLFKISIISMCNNGISETLYLLDIFVLGIIISDETIIASYKVATTIPSACLFIPLSIITYIYPYFASKKDDKEWTLSMYRKLLIALILVNGVVSFLLIVLAKPIIVIIFGKQYIDAVLCFRILAINYFFSGTFRVISGNLLVTQRKLTFNLIVNVLCGGINVVGNIVLIPLLHSEGAALTTLFVVFVSSIMSTVYYVYVLKKK